MHNAFVRVIEVEGDSPSTLVEDNISNHCCKSESKASCLATYVLTNMLLTVASITFKFDECNAAVLFSLRLIPANARIMN